MILFLDFDGVLHPEPCYDLAKLFCYRNLLEDCLRPFPDVHVVITSTWREKYALSHLRFLLGPEVGQRVINVTPSWRDVCDLGDVVPYQRQAEIEAWLRREGRGWEDWVALDDKPWLFKPFLPNLVLCDRRTGLDEAAAQKLREKLGKRW